MVCLRTVGMRVTVILLTFYLNCLTAVASRTIHERLQALEEANFKIFQVLATKSDRIEALEDEVQQLKAVALNNERDVKKKDLGTPVNNQTTGKYEIFRTCRETHLADPSLASGMYWIDPDGHGVGDDPIQVYCNMTTGTTSILHDSETPTDVGRCANPGCYSKSINYSASKRQLTALIELSSECHQSIRYDCNYAPFKINGVPYSWWNDRNGIPQFFWAGSNSSVHTCQCGIDRKCLESIMSCDCDSNLPTSKFDDGVIRNKNHLPVTQLNFGRTLMETSSGIYTLGRFECSGQVAVVNRMPSSCSDLWQIGHILSGLYSVMGTSMIENVYCNFTKLPSENGFENRLGYVDVKLLPVYFYVQKNATFNVTNAPIPFEIERTNIGGAMNLTSGVFTAPRAGVYFFTFSGVAALFNSSSRSYLEIGLVLNDNYIGTSLAERGVAYNILSLQSTFNMKAGDRVSLKINSMVNSYLFDGGNHHTHFTGQLLQEDIPHS